MSDTIEVNGYNLPTLPYEGGPELYNRPSDDRRWAHYNDGDTTDIHVLWVGTCQCDYCGYQLWEAAEEVPQTSIYTTDSIMRSIWGGSFTPASRERMIGNGMIPEDWSEEWLPCISWDCVTRESRRVTALDKARREVASRLIKWPADIFADLKEREEKRIADERAKIAHLLEPYPVIPVRGAYVWVEDESEPKFERFDEWTDDGQIKVIGRSEPFDVEKVLAATSVIYDVPHHNGAIVPGHGKVSQKVEVIRYSSINATVRLAGGTTTTVPVNALAVLVPPLNPATESAKHKALRLERELDRVKESLYRRMVAEGVARSWCSEFDPILDSNGLKPRKLKSKVRGTIEFEFEADKPIPEQTLTKLLKGSASVSSHIPMTGMVVTRIEQDEPMGSPLLS